MPYKGDEIRGNAAIREHCANGFGRLTKYSEDELKQAETLVYEHSSFKDPGPDWNKTHLIDADGHRIASRRETGY